MRWCISEAPAMMDATIARVDNASSKPSLVRNRRRLKMFIVTASHNGTVARICAQPHEETVNRTFRDLWPSL